MLGKGVNLTALWEVGEAGGGYEEVAPLTSQPPLTPPTSPNLPNLLQPYLTSVLPYKDENPTELTPVITLGIIVLNVLAWLFVQGAGAAEPLARSVCQLGLIPGEVLHTVPPGTAVPLGEGLRCVLTADANWWTVVTSMFMHGGWLHLIGNMWFLLVFGNNIEDSMGHARFVVFYLLSGVAAAATQMLVDPGSRIPMVGASGAISGVMGAYILLYPRVRVHTLITLGFFLTTVTLPAYVILGYWFVLQLLFGTVGALSGAQGGVAVGCSSFRVVLDRLTLHDEDDVFRDVGGEIRHALEVAADQEQIHGRSDDVRVFHHMGEQDAEHGVVQGVDGIVAPADLPPQLRVATHEGIERAGEHGARLTGHLEQLGLGGDEPGAEQPLGRLRDVHRVVADPLQVVGDLGRRHQKPEVPRHGLLGGEQVDHGLLDFELEGVDGVIACDHPDGELAVAAQQGVERAAQGVLGFARHGQELGLQLRQLIVKVAVCCRRRGAHPNRPVM